MPVYYPNDLEKSIRKAVDVQIRHHIDVVSDGEQRADMIKYFEQIPGLSTNKNSLYVDNKIRKMDNPNDFVKMKDLLLVKEYLREKHAGKALKATLTGPVTLGFTAAMSGLNYYSSARDERLFLDAAEALADIARTMLDSGIRVQVDEPGISAGFAEPSVVARAIGLMVEGLSETHLKEKRVSMHICGPIPLTLIRHVLRLPIPVLSFAFSSQQERVNLDRLSRKDLESHGKVLGLGCHTPMISDIQLVDSVEIALNRLRNMLERFGEENAYYVHPDCGLRDVSPEVAERILETIDNAVSLLS